jgi:ribosomal protein S15P/S13E
MLFDIMLTKTIKYLDIKLNRYKRDFKSYNRLEKVTMHRRDQFFGVMGEFFGWI